MKTIIRISSIWWFLAAGAFMFGHYEPSHLTIFTGLIGTGVILLTA